MVSPSFSRRKLTLELLVIAALSALAFHLSYGYVTTRGFDYFYQDFFSPALSVACGGGFAQVDNAATAAFLSGYRNPDVELACSELVGAKIAEPDRFQMAHEWLLRAVAAFWRVFGIKWSSIAILSATLFAATIVSSYLMLRAFAGRVAALICSACFMLSTPHLFNTTGLRDYGKAPFVIAALAICAHLVARRMWPTKFVALSALLALTIHVGALFRSDIIGVLPFALFSIVIAMPLMRGEPKVSSHDAEQAPNQRRVWLAREVIIRSAACALCIAAGLSVARPVERGGLWSNVLHGHFHPLLIAMGVATGEYLHGTIHNDIYRYELVHALSMRRAETPEDVFADAQVRPTRDLYLNIVRDFPGDALTNAIAGVLQVARLNSRNEYLPPGPDYGAYRSLVESLAALRNRINYPTRGLIIPSLAVIVLFAGSPRRGLWLLALFGWCGLVASGQWHPRHTFHMEIVPWMALSVLLAAGWQVLGIRRISGTAMLVRGASRLLVLAGILVLAVTVLVAVRYHQQTRVRAVFSEILGADRAPLELVVTQRPGTRSADLQFDRFWQYPSETAAAFDEHNYLAVVFDPNRAGCDTSHVWLGLGYAGFRTGYADLSQSYGIELSRAGRTTFFAPVFRSGLAHFHRVFVSDAACVERIDKVTGNVPFLLTLVLAPDWELRWHYSRLSYYEPAPDARLQVVDLDVGECRRITNISSLIELGDETTRQGDSLRVHLPATGTSHLRREDVELQEGDCLDLHGKTSHAPIFVGLSHQQQEAFGVLLLQPGSFGQILKVPKTGRYRLLLEYRGVGMPQSLIEFRADP